MTLYYSASTNGFYDDTIHIAEQIQANAKEITLERHTELLNGQSSGKQIVSDNAGFPVLQDPPPAKLIQVTRITRAQGKKHLLAKGKYGVVKDYVDSAQSTDAMRIGFYDEEYWLINDPFVLATAELLMWDSEQLQHEFNEAAKI
jgi:hypothetical protein